MPTRACQCLLLLFLQKGPSLLAASTGEVSLAAGSLVYLNCSLKMPAECESVYVCEQG